MNDEVPDRLPPRTEDFLDWLDMFHPPRCPHPGESMEEIQRYAGARGLIDAMRHRWLTEYTEQDEDEDPAVGSIFE